ncbi:MAG: hypothetical protein RBT20_01760, partial [Syntrophales bacterium]|nr:hypothetical protein [Syntrophales bacterium]
SWKPPSGLFLGETISTQLLVLTSLLYHLEVSSQHDYLCIQTDFKSVPVPEFCPRLAVLSAGKVVSQGRLPEKFVVLLRLVEDVHYSRTPSKTT